MKALTLPWLKRGDMKQMAINLAKGLTEGAEYEKAYQLIRDTKRGACANQEIKMALIELNEYRREQAAHGSKFLTKGLIPVN